jgi:putative nucleotidyltransferase with HDIG domain
MITRTEALKRVQSEVKTKNLIKHMLAVEACMRALAGKLGQNEELWGLTGLLHDLDYEQTKDNPEQHALTTCQMLADSGLPRESLDAILAHNAHKPCESQLEIALYAVDPTSGFLVSCALMHPDKKLASLDLEFIKNRMKEKRFSAAVSREQMAECQKLGIELDEFLELCLEAMQGISEELGL